VQSKDYLQNLIDEGKVKTEKIGAGNWYWSFAGNEQAALQLSLDKATEEHRKVTLDIETLQAKLKEALQAQSDDESMLDDTEMDRQTAMELQSKLTNEVKELQKEVDLYRDLDPAVLQERKREVRRTKDKLETVTDNICAMETEIKKVIYGRKEQQEQFKNWYGDEWSEDDGGLRELPI